MFDISYTRSEMMTKLLFENGKPVYNFKSSSELRNKVKPITPSKPNVYISPSIRNTIVNFNI